MQFVYPSFLFALFAIAIPIIIHLFNFRRYKKIIFSDIRFLKQVIEQNQKQQTIKNWLVLLCRILAIAFLVFAFAQPYIPYQKNKNIQTEKAVSVFIDNSFSMSAMGKEGELLETAKNKARQIADVYKNDCQFQLLTNDFEGKHQRLVSKQDFIQMIDDVKLSASGKSYEQIISRQTQALSSGNSQKIAYVISDFQQKQYNLNDYKIDSNIQVKLIPIEAEKQQNIFIDSVWLVSPIIKVNSQIKIKVRLRNESEDNIENLPLVLKLNNIQKALQNFSCESHAFTDIEMVCNIGNETYQQAELSLLDNPITFDDKLFFTLIPSKETDVLIINDKSENAFLNSVFKVDEFYKVEVQNIKQLDFAAFKNKQLIILNEPENISSGLIDELKKQVLNDAYLLVIPPANPNQMAGINSLAVALSNIQYSTQTIQELKIDKINTKDDLLKDVFTKLPQNMDAPMLHRFYALQISSSTRGNDIFSMNNGVPFIFKSSLGKGKIFYATCAFSDEFTSFQKHSLFVPFMLKLGLGKQAISPLYYSIGNDKQIIFNHETEDKIAYLNKDKFEMVADVKNLEEKKSMFVDEQIKDAGFYQIKGSNKKDVLGNVSFNYNRTESYTKNYSTSDLEKLHASSEIITDDINTMKKKLELEEYGKAYWHYALWLMLIFILSEILLLRLMK